MRFRSFLPVFVVGGLVLGGLETPALAADKPLFAAPPAWVKPVPIPAADPADKGPVSMLLRDEQYNYADGEEGAYLEGAFKVNTAAGLSGMGTFLAEWQPDISTLTIHKIQILRGGQTIDLLKDGSGISVLRRENNLEAETLDGILTATMVIEGLQVGDILDFSYSTTGSDPVLKGHRDAILDPWPGAPVQSTHVSVRLPPDKAVAWRTYDAPADFVARVDGKDRVMELSTSKLEPYKAPAGAPPRFQFARRVQLSDFKSWQEVSALMAPLFDKARTLKDDSPIKAEIDKIRAASSDPKQQAAAALALVEDKVRYVAIIMNRGELVPADADLTWSRRFGDCKAKTALLLALLDGLGVKAEPVLVNAENGDGIDQRLPTVGAFEHVIVKAEIDGRAYWLDGTHLGDRAIDDIAAPAFRWGLPLTDAGMDLEPIVQTTPEQPALQIDARIDESAGVALWAPLHAEMTVRGDAGRQLGLAASFKSEDEKDKLSKSVWTGAFPSAVVTTAKLSTDAAGDLHVVMDGRVPPAWARRTTEQRGLEVYLSKLEVGRIPTRDPGPHNDAPFAVGFPLYAQWNETIVLPKGRSGFSLAGGDIDKTVGGRALSRTAKLDGDTLTMQVSLKALVPEISATEAKAAAPVLTQLANAPLTLVAPEPLFSNENVERDVLKTEPRVPEDYVQRAGLLLRIGETGKGLAAIDKAIDMGLDGPLPLLDKAQLLRATRRYDEAKAAIDKGLEKKPNAALLRQFKTELLNLHLAQKQYDAALDDANSILTDAPQDPAALGLRAGVYLVRKDFDSALADVEAGLAAAPNNVDLYRVKANILRAQGKGAELAALADDIVSKNPADAVAVEAAAVFRCSAGDHAACMDDFARSLALKPLAETYFNRAGWRDSAERDDIAKDIAAALALDASFRSLSTAGLIEAVQGDYLAAIELLKRVKAIDGAPVVESRLAAAYERTGQHALAESEYRLARAQATGDATLLNALCWDQATAGVHLDRALVDCKASVAAHREGANLDSLGLVLLRSGHYSDAVAAYNEAIELTPFSADSIYGKGVAEMRLGQNDAGKADIAKAHAMTTAAEFAFARYGVTP